MERPKLAFQEIRSTIAMLVRRAERVKDVQIVLVPFCAATKTDVYI